MKLVLQTAASRRQSGPGGIARPAAIELGLRWTDEHGATCVSRITFHSAPGVGT
jgi:hypothetical protein